jgi:transketolase N-terminal domain/subunit
MPERRMVLTDDFGQRIQMSTERLRDLMAAVTSGSLGRALSDVGF